MKYLRWFFLIVGIFGLMGVRAIEEVAFYDPFLGFFHEANESSIFPAFEWDKLILHYFFRFGLNVFFSCLIVHFLFLNKNWTKQSILLMLIVFFIFFSIYLYCISTEFKIGYQFSFYMRRFVIQPLILLLIIPIFYYRKRTIEEKAINHQD